MVVEVFYCQGRSSFSNSFSSSVPFSLIATIFPSGSTRKLSGIPRTPYNLPASLSHPLRSDTCCHFSWSFLMASSHALRPSDLSSETPSMVKFFVLNFSYTRTMLGFSRRQGPHQEAQKSI